MTNPTFTPRRPAGRIRIGVLVATVSLIASLLPAAVATAADAANGPDGLSQETAAASCWEIKQSNPAAADGIYWLVTPSLVAPEQFYCDQTTDGGGWVLIGRGREAWKEGYNGLRTPALLRNSPSGVEAFRPAQLPAATVDGLLDGNRVDALPDGIRLRRAKNAAGSQWQEVRFTMTQRDRWVWTFGANHRVARYSFDGSHGSNGLTNNFGSNNQFNRVVFSEQSSHQYTNGWAYGSSLGGSTASDSYLWAPSGQGYARPFTQMFLRPQLKLADLDFATIPASGTPATTVAAIPESDALRTSWGVSGFANGNSGELNTEVAAFGEAAGKVFVGGNFKYVQTSEAGADQVQQSYLAAFDVNTGQWDSSFRPSLNGQVKAITALPDGRIAIGGQFSTVNGTSQTALAFLDPATGEISGPQVHAEHRNSGGVPYVRGFDIEDGYLYVAGAFTHLVSAAGIAGGAWNGGRIALSDTRPDTNWNAFLNGTSVDIDASSQGDRTYFSGYFRMKGSTLTPSGAALETTPGAPVVTPLWRPTFSKSGLDGNGNITGNVWQLGVQEVGDSVWLGGSEHSLFEYNRNTFALERGSITMNGGDFQTVETNGSLIIAGCHCGDWVYQDAYTWNDPGTTWKEADKMNLVGAWDVTTGDYVAAWSPVLSARAGYGAWGSFFDSTGTLWVGGDFRRSVRSGEVAQWSGGFVRFAPKDTSAPTQPGVISATGTTSEPETTLSWGASTDNSSVVYEVLRGDRVIATTSELTYTVQRTDEEVDYFVRARDDSGNRSASTAAYTVQPLSETAMTIVDNGSTWSWRYSSDALPADWNTLSFDDSEWATGAGLFARGVAGSATDIDPTELSPRPLSAQFRHTFTVQNALTIVNGTITAIADDGMVLYLNGVELGRTRLGAGKITQSTYATGVVSHTAASAARTVFTVPQGALLDGENILAASVHANYRATPDLSFDLSFTAERGDAPDAPSAVTELTATSTVDSVTLVWSAPTGGTAPMSYSVSRDDQAVGTTDAATTTLTETDLQPETEYTYSVIALGPGGLASAPSQVSVTTMSPPAANTLPVTVDATSTWAWRYSADAIDPEWNTAAFDDSGWATGSGLFGRGIAAADVNIDPDALSTKPLSAQFRHTFTAEDALSLQDGSLTVIADDGVIVYLNGIELGRANLPAETAVTQNTYATAAPRHSTAAANPIVLAVPANLLLEGENVLSASIQANYRNTPDLGFSLSMSLPRL